MKFFKFVINVAVSLAVMAAAVFLIIKYLDILIKPYNMLREKLSEVMNCAGIPAQRVRVQMDDEQEEPSGI